MLPIHVIMLILCDIFAYKVEVMSIVADIGFIWLDYFNYITLHKVFCLLEIFGLLLNTLVAMSHIQRIV
jgi:hypothetical protein